MRLTWLVTWLVRASTCATFVIAASWSSKSYAQPSKPPAGVCVNVKDDPVLVEMDRGKVKYCFDHGKRLHCYSTSLDDGSLWVTAAPAHNNEPYPAIPEPPDSHSIEIDEAEVKVCPPHSTECKTFKPKPPIILGVEINANVNRSNTLVTLTNGIWIETFDMKSGKRLARFKAGKAKHRCSYADFAGDSLVVDHYDCADPKLADSWIGTKTGKRLSTIGGKQPLVGMTTNPVQISDKQWAFANVTGDAIAIHDIKTGKHVKTIRIGGAPSTDEVTPALVYAEDEASKQLVLVYGKARAGDVVVVDLATSNVSSYPANRCK